MEANIDNILKVVVWIFIAVGIVAILVKAAPHIVGSFGGFSGTAGKFGKFF